MGRGVGVGRGERKGVGRRQGHRRRVRFRLLPLLRQCHVALGRQDEVQGKADGQDRRDPARVLAPIMRDSTVHVPCFLCPFDEDNQIRIPYAGMATAIGIVLKL